MLKWVPWELLVRACFTECGDGGSDLVGASCGTQCWAVGGGESWQCTGLGVCFQLEHPVGQKRRDCLLGYAKGRPWMEHRWFPPEVILEVQQNGVSVYCA